MLPVCEPRDSYSTAWVEQGFSRCFLELVGSISGAGVLFVLGLGTIILGMATGPLICVGGNSNIPHPFR